MPEELMEGVNPTRMELLEIRKKLNLAEKGHKLLEEKRDSLVEQFFTLIDHRNELKKDMNSKFSTAFTALLEAQMILGEDHVVDYATLIPDIGEVSFTTENIMGVSLPTLEKQKRPLQKPPYGFYETCARLDDSYILFSKLRDQVLDLASVEGRIKSLATEIEKTKRRVNVLENTLIPKLQATQKHIEMQLEEREREDFFRRKRIKALMESKEEENR